MQRKERNEMDENKAAELLNAMNLYIRASEELAVILDNIHTEETVATAWDQLQYSYTLFQNAFYNAAHLRPVFHPSKVVVQPGIVYPHGIGRSEDKVVWSEPYWTVEH